MKFDITELLIIFDELLIPPTDEEQGVYWFRATRTDGLIVTLSFSVYECYAGVLICNSSDVAVASVNMKKCSQIRGWINYYGKFYGSSLRKLKTHIDGTLVRWLRRKHKKLAQRKWGSYEWLERVKSKNPKLFVHWYLGKAY